MGIKMIEVHLLRLTCEATTRITFGLQAGAQIRGALWEMLQVVCAHAGDPNSDLHPARRLLMLELESARGQNPARPFAIRPSLPMEQTIAPRQQFTFGVNLYGDAVELFPYVVQAVYRMGQAGVGYGRGRFVLVGVEAVNPLQHEAQSLMRGGKMVQMPGLPLTETDVMLAADRLPNDRITLNLLTPTQIVANGQRLSQLTFESLIARLLERYQAIEQHYTTTPTSTNIWRKRHLEMTQAAGLIRIKQDNTRWVRVESGSRRTGTRNSVGGLVGDITFEGDLQVFLPWLVWGSLLHVGKNAVKGSGWYELSQLDADSLQ